MPACSPCGRLSRGGWGIDSEQMGGGFPRLGAWVVGSGQVSHGVSRRRRCWWTDGEWVPYPVGCGGAGGLWDTVHGWGDSGVTFWSCCFSTGCTGRTGSWGLRRCFGQWLGLCLIPAQLPVHAFCLSGDPPVPRPNPVRYASLRSRTSGRRRSRSPAARWGGCGPMPRRGWRDCR